MIDTKNHSTTETDSNYLKLLEERVQKAQQDHQEALRLLNLSIMNLHAAQQSLDDFKAYLEYKQNAHGAKRGEKGAEI